MRKPFKIYSRRSENDYQSCKQVIIISVVSLIPVDTGPPYNILGTNTIAIIPASIGNTIKTSFIFRWQKNVSVGIRHLTTWHCLSTKVAKNTEITKILDFQLCTRMFRRCFTYSRLLAVISIFWVNVLVGNLIKLNLTWREVCTKKVFIWLKTPATLVSELVPYFSVK